LAKVGRKRFGLGTSLVPQSLGQRLQSIAPPCHQDQIVSISRETLGKGRPYA